MNTASETYNIHITHVYCWLMKYYSRIGFGVVMAGVVGKAVVLELGRAFRGKIEQA